MPTRRRRSFGRLRKLPSGRWQAAYVGPDGKLHTAPRTYARESDAEGWLAAERRKIDLGTWGAVERSDGITVGEYAKRWIDQRDLRQGTKILYRSLLRRLIDPDIGDIKLAALTPARVRQWYAGLDAAYPTRAANAYKLLHAVCATAVADEVLDGNPARIVGASQSPRRRDINLLTPAEVDQVAAEMPPWLAASVVLAAWCGLRWGETSELRRKDLTDDCSLLRVRRAVTYHGGQFHTGPPKTAAGVRDVAVPPHIRPVLAEHLAAHVYGPGPEVLLFGEMDGSHIHRDAYRKHWVKARDAIGKPNLRVHDLRHVGAVLAAQSGATTVELMHRLGHTTPAMSLRYQHVAEGRDAEIAARLSKLVTVQS